MSQLSRLSSKYRRTAACAGRPRRVVSGAGSVIAALAVTATLAGCGSAGGGATASMDTPGASGGSVRLVESTFPQSLDPGFDYSNQGFEVNWIVYTGLLTYKHANAVAHLIPGLATALPKITDGGKTYTMTLRHGLVFSNGKPVVAADFKYTFERAVKIPWGGSGEFMTPVVRGASAYAAGKAKTISGITTNNRTGKIVVHLTHAYGAFDNVLAEPALGLVPAGIPMHNMALAPPPGVGPYTVKNIVANSSYDVVQNPLWSKMHIPEIPSGHVHTIHVQVATNVTANAMAVLDNKADIFDYSDVIPGGTLAQVAARARGRFKLVGLGSGTWYLFLNARRKPFSSQLAREAVVTGLNENAMDRMASGTLAPGCYFLPAGLPGHSSASCPYGTPGDGNLAKAKALLKQSGMEGQPVTVWASSDAPVSTWMGYYTQLLNQIGLKATEKTVSSATYRSTVGELRLGAQTGANEWIEDFPNPVDFYGVILDGHAILKTNNLNLSVVSDPHINATVAKLSVIPTPELQQSAPGWEALDRYEAQKAYVAVFGYPKFPKFVSDRINYRALILNPLYGWDMTSFELK